jgi:hypothetical protein
MSDPLMVHYLVNSGMGVFYAFLSIARFERVLRVDEECCAILPE